MWTPGVRLNPKWRAGWGFACVTSTSHCLLFQVCAWGLHVRPTPSQYSRSFPVVSLDLSRSTVVFYENINSFKDFCSFFYASNFCLKLLWWIPPVLVMGRGAFASWPPPRSSGECPHVGSWVQNWVLALMMTYVIWFGTCLLIPNLSRTSVGNFVRCFLVFAGMTVIFLLWS